MIIKFDKFISINEFKLSTDNYSKYYYLVLKLDERTIQNLISKKLDGLKGISDSIDILNSFFDIRDLLLVMKKEEVEKFNNVEKVEYDNVEYLTKNNFKIIKRLYHVNDEYSLTSLLYQAFRRVNYLRHEKIEDHNLNKLYRIVMSKAMWSKYDFLDKNIHKLDDIKIDSYNDLLEKSFIKFKELKFDLTKEELDTIFQFIILSFASRFKKEGEILVKNDFFTIPEKSVLFIKAQNVDSFKYDESRKIIDKYMDKLKTIYNIKILPYVSGFISNTHKPAFGMIRYLDKFFNSSTI